MKIHCGTDIVEVKRIQEALDRHGENFLRKFLNEEEILFLLKESKGVNYLAGRWALKEALYKCFKGEIALKDIHQISIWNHKTGSPYLKESSLLKDWHIDTSISHEKLYATAMAVAIKKA